jgi:hypothetical protein
VTARGPAAKERPAAWYPRTEKVGPEGQVVRRDVLWAVYDFINEKVPE